MNFCDKVFIPFYFFPLMSNPALFVWIFRETSQNGNCTPLRPKVGFNSKIAFVWEINKRRQTITMTETTFWINSTKCLNVIKISFSVSVLGTWFSELIFQTTTFQNQRNSKWEFGRSEKQLLQTEKSLLVFVCEIQKFKHTKGKCRREKHFLKLSFWETRGTNILWRSIDDKQCWENLFDESICEQKIQQSI